MKPRVQLTCFFLAAVILLVQILIARAQPVTLIAAGGYHTLFGKSDGSLWVMGNNIEGQLGDGSTNRSLVPNEILSTNVAAISGGEYDSLFVANGALWGMGANGFGELGIGTYADTNRPARSVSSGVTTIAAGKFHSFFIKTDGSLWGMGYDVYGELGDGRYDLLAAVWNQPA